MLSQLLEDPDPMQYQAWLNAGQVDSTQSLVCTRNGKVQQRLAAIELIFHPREVTGSVTCESNLS